MLDIGIQVAEALEYSHARGVVHRDIKPENIMVAREQGAGVRVRVMDFGLARAASDGRMTRTGTLIGHARRISAPSRSRGREVDGRADIYALGTVLYECVVGEPPFSGEAQSLLYRIVHEFPQPPRARRRRDRRGARDDHPRVPREGPRAAAASARRDVADALQRYRAGHARQRPRSATSASSRGRLHYPRARRRRSSAAERETAELQHRLNAAVAGECQFAAGRRRARDRQDPAARGARESRQGAADPVLHGRSIEQDRGLPYQGFCELLLEHFRSEGLGQRAAGRSVGPGPRARVAASRCSPRSRRCARGLQAARRSTAGRWPLPTAAAQIFELLARTLTRIAGGRPLVLLLEDLHAAEVSLEALDYIVRRLGPTPTLIVGTYRSTEIHARHPLNRMIEALQGERRARLSDRSVPLSGLRAPVVSSKR